MRSDPGDYELVAPKSLQAALALFGHNPGEWLPIAGGTDVMVQYAAGKLPSRKLVSVWNLPELRRIEVLNGEVRVGAGSTYSDLRDHETLSREFPLLTRAARWTGGVANQNRGTIGGNIVNASPAADSLPALLAYDAELILISARGERRLPYPGFHTGYKKTQLAPDELIQAVCLPRRYSGYFHHARKVGARNAQAISKVCIAAIGRATNGKIEDIHIALGSVAPVPIRLVATEEIVRGKSIDEELISLAKKIVVSEIRPIDDIRSTAAYRAGVAGNLVEEFLLLMREKQGGGSEVLARWNVASLDAAAAEILPCCGSRVWAGQMAQQRPFANEAALVAASDDIWRGLSASDWMEAFRSHPRIGESSREDSDERSATWATQEQKMVADAAREVKIALAEGNRDYVERFGYIFIVCATGKSAAEMLEILKCRMHNDADSELLEAAEQQRQITQIRLRKWLQS